MPTWMNRAHAKYYLTNCCHVAEHRTGRILGGEELVGLLNYLDGSRRSDGDEPNRAIDGVLPSVDGSEPSDSLPLSARRGPDPPAVPPQDQEQPLPRMIQVEDRWLFVDAYKTAWMLVPTYDPSMPLTIMKHAYDYPPPAPVLPTRRTRRSR